MSINLDNVKAITHNNKDVIKIEDSNGNVIWSARQTTTGTYSQNFAGSGTNYPTATLVSSSSTSPYTSYYTLPSIDSLKASIASSAGISASDIVSIDSVNVTIGIEKTTVSNSRFTGHGRTSFTSGSTLPGSSIFSVCLDGNGTSTYTFDAVNFLNQSTSRNIYLYKENYITTSGNRIYAKVNAWSTISGNYGFYGAQYYLSGYKYRKIDVTYTYYA